MTGGKVLGVVAKLVGQSGQVGRQTRLVAGWPR
jgi:hypothetical protein